MPSVEAARKAERLVGRTKKVQALRPAGHLPRLRPVNKRYKIGARVTVVRLRVRTLRSAVEEIAAQGDPELRGPPTNNLCKCNILVVAAGRRLGKLREHLMIDGQTAAALLDDARHVAGKFIDDCAREDECYESAATIAC